MSSTRATARFDRLFPQRADNTYRGHRLALWFFGLLVLVKAGIGLGSIFNGYTAASSADGIPLDSFTPAAAQTVLSLFALLGVSQLVICLLYQLSRYLILHFLPVPRTGTPPGSAINLVLLGVMIVGLALSLRSQDNLQAQE